MLMWVSFACVYQIPGTPGGCFGGIVCVSAFAGKGVSQNVEKIIFRKGRLHLQVRGCIKFWGHTRAYIGEVVCICRQWWVCKVFTLHSMPNNVET